MNDRVETIEIGTREAGMRLDRWFRLHFPDVTNGYLQKLLRSGQVRVDSRRVEGKERLEAGRQGARAEGRAHAANRKPDREGRG